MANLAIKYMKRVVLILLILSYLFCLVNAGRDYYDVLVSADSIINSLLNLIDCDRV